MQTPRDPQRGHDPLARDLEHYADEDRCRTLFFWARWPKGFTCQACGQPGVLPNDRNRVVCPRCKKSVSLTAGTVLQGTRKPLRLWFRAAYLLARGASARQLSRELHLTYKVAWTWAQKLRAAMKEGVLFPWRVDRPPLNFRHGEATRRLQEGELQLKFERERLDPPPCEGCLRVGREDWGSASYDPRRPWIPQQRSWFAELAHQRVLDVYSGHVSQKHLQRYLDEFAFVFNRRPEAYRSVGPALTIFALAATTPPHPYPAIIGRGDPAPRIVIEPVVPATERAVG